jgi:hypothetical protein
MCAHALAQVEPDFIYRGAVLVFFGHANGSLSAEPDFVISSDTDMMAFGSVLARGA